MQSESSLDEPESELREILDVSRDLLDIDLERVLDLDLELKLEFDLDCDLDLDINLGLDLELKLELEFDLGLDLDLEPKLNLELDLGLDLDLEHKLKLELDLELDLGLNLDLDFDLVLDLDLDLDTELVLDLLVCWMELEISTTFFCVSAIFISSREISFLLVPENVSIIFWFSKRTDSCSWPSELGSRFLCEIFGILMGDKLSQGSQKSIS